MLYHQSVVGEFTLAAWTQDPMNVLEVLRCLSTAVSEQIQNGNYLLQRSLIREGCMALRTGFMSFHDMSFAKLVRTKNNNVAVLAGQALVPT